MTTGARVRSPQLAEPSTLARIDAAEGYVVRFDGHQRLQHFVMLSSFIILALTGLPQKFSSLAISQWWVSSLGGLETVRSVHRAVGFVMLADCLYHVAYLFQQIAIRRRFGALRMIPAIKDLQDVGQTVSYFLGFAREKPKFDRFSYLEKFDYWAVFWGIAVIGGSGMVLMFPVEATNYLPGQTIAVALAMHSDEALLAVGWILIVHMFNAHLAPWIFPFDPTIFTGRVRAERYAEEHPLEWAQIASLESAQPRDGSVEGGAQMAPADASSSTIFEPRLRSIRSQASKRGPP